MSTQILLDTEKKSCISLLVINLFALLFCFCSIKDFSDQPVKLGICGERNHICLPLKLRDYKRNKTVKEVGEPHDQQSNCIQ